MALSDTEICNLALAELPDKPIATMDEASLQARECRRVYKHAVDELLQAHPWTFAKTRLALAQLTNDRPSEWAYAYALPADLGMVRKVVNAQTLPDPTALLLVGQTFAPIGANSLWDRAPAQPYVIAGRTLYSDVLGAVLEYLPADELEGTFSPLFVKALYFDIASRICTPLTKKSDKKKELVTQAELWKARAQAADLNSQQNTYDPVPDALRSLG